MLTYMHIHYIEQKNTWQMYTVHVYVCTDIVHLSILYIQAICSYKQLLCYGWRGCMGEMKTLVVIFYLKPIMLTPSV